MIGLNGNDFSVTGFCIRKTPRLVMFNRPLQSLEQSSRQIGLFVALRRLVGGSTEFELGASLLTIY